MNSTITPFLAPRYVLAGLVSCSVSTALATTPQLIAEQMAGSVEIRTFGSVWRPLTQKSHIQQGVRTGSGRVLLRHQQAQYKSKGQIVVGSHSNLRLNKQKPDFQTGKFWLTGPISAYVLGTHVALSQSGEIRIDISANGKQRRLAVLSGKTRIALHKKIITLHAGQQLNFNGRKIQTFQENDPWYKARFLGSGTAKIEAAKGSVKLSRAQKTAKVNIGETLNTKDLLITGNQAWAEIGFEGGGYLRLGEQSNLRVLGIEKTSRGREVYLHLLKGSAWNVISKGKGGYQLTTPVVSTAVRGTKFRVDANGLIKVLEGDIYIPSSRDQALTAGQQRNINGQTGKLKLDAFDKQNLALDKARLQPLTLNIQRFPQYLNQLTLSGKTLPNTKLIATFRQPQGKTSLPVKVTKDGQFTIPLHRLPENDYQMRLRAQRFGKVRIYSTRVSIDRTAPIVDQLQQSTQGHITLLTGYVNDNSQRAVLLEAKVGDTVIAKRKVLGKFRMLLNSMFVADEKVTLHAVDTAGNEVNATSP